jgi:hypothetical protein
MAVADRLLGLFPRWPGEPCRFIIGLYRDRELGYTVRHS